MTIQNGAKVFIRNRTTGKYLFFLRDNKPNILYPNMWGILGGGIEEGETPREALARELQEESNVNVDNLRELGSTKVIHTVNENGVEQHHTADFFVFLAETDDMLDTLELYEGQRLEYFTIEEVKRQNNLAPTIRTIIGKYEEKLI